MRDTPRTLEWLDYQRASGSTAWHNMCESLARQARGIPAHYPSANAHAAAVPASFRHGHEPPSAGDLVLYVNSTYGHIVTATGRGWDCYTNDYGGRGRVTITDARNLVSWCHASSWFVADAWWSPSTFARTHNPTTPGDDVPLDKSDIDAVANAVWNKVYRDPVTDADASTASLLLRTRRDANTAATRPGGGGGGGDVVLSDADVARVAAAVLDGMSSRLRA